MSITSIQKSNSVIQSKRKGIVHLEKMKDTDFLDLLNEIQDPNTGKFDASRITMNVKVDGFSGRFGFDETGIPFVESSRSGPKFRSGEFSAYVKEKGITDRVQVNRALLFDRWFDRTIEVAKRINKRIDLTDIKIHVEVLYLPMAEKQADGRLKFVGISYNPFPKNIDMILVPLFAERASTGELLENSDRIIEKIAFLKQVNSTLFVSNRLSFSGNIDVSSVIPEDLNGLQVLANSKKLVQKREAKARLQPVKDKLGNVILNHPSILGKDMLGKDYEGIILNTRNGPVKITTPEQKQIIANKAIINGKTAVVAIGSFVGHIGHQQLWNYTKEKALELKGDPYLFIGNGIGKDDPIPPSIKLKTWHKLHKDSADCISTVIEGGTLMQKIKHELINPLPGKPPRYDNVVIMVGEDQKDLPIANALMKAVNKFHGYEHVTVKLQVTPRKTGVKFTDLRNVLQDSSLNLEQKYQIWSKCFDETVLGKRWILHLMAVTRKGMNTSLAKNGKYKRRIQGSS